MRIEVSLPIVHVPDHVLESVLESVLTQVPKLTTEPDYNLVLDHVSNLELVLVPMVNIVPFPFVYELQPALSYVQ